MDNSIIVRFTADDGEEFELEVVQTVEYEDEFYAIMLPVEEDEEEEAETVVLELSSDEEDETCEVVEDEAVLEAVFAIFDQHCEELDV